MASPDVCVSSERVELMKSLFSCDLLQLADEVFIHQSTKECCYFDENTIEAYDSIATYHGFDKHITAVDTIMSTDLKFGGPFSRQCLLVLDLVLQGSKLLHPQFAEYEKYLEKPHIKQELLRLSTTLHAKEATHSDYYDRIKALYGTRFENENHPYHESTEKYAEVTAKYELDRILDDIRGKGLGWYARNLAYEPEDGPEEGEIEEYEVEDEVMEDAEHESDSYDAALWLGQT